MPSSKGTIKTEEGGNTFKSEFDVEGVKYHFDGMLEIPATFESTSAELLYESVDLLDTQVPTSIEGRLRTQDFDIDLKNSGIRIIGKRTQPGPSYPLGGQGHWFHDE